MLGGGEAENDQATRERVNGQSHRGGGPSVTPDVEHYRCAATLCF